MSININQPKSDVVIQNNEILATDLNLVFLNSTPINLYFKLRKIPDVSDINFYNNQNIGTLINNIKSGLSTTYNIKPDNIVSANDTLNYINSLYGNLSNIRLCRIVTKNPNYSGSMITNYNPSESTISTYYKYYKTADYFAVLNPERYIQSDTNPNNIPEDNLSSNFIKTNSGEKSRINYQENPDQLSTILDNPNFYLDIKNNQISTGKEITSDSINQLIQEFNKIIYPAQNTANYQNDELYHNKLSCCFANDKYAGILSDPDISATVNDDVYLKVYFKYTGNTNISILRNCFEFQTDQEYTNTTENHILSLESLQRIKTNTTDTVIQSNWETKTRNTYDWFSIGLLGIKRVINSTNIQFKKWIMVNTETPYFSEVNEILSDPNLLVQHTSTYPYDTTDPWNTLKDKKICCRFNRDKTRKYYWLLPNLSFTQSTTELSYIDNFSNPKPANKYASRPGNQNGLYRLNNTQPYGVGNNTSATGRIPIDDATKIYGLLYTTATSGSGTIPFWKIITSASTHNSYVSDNNQNYYKISDFTQLTFSTSITVTNTNYTNTKDIGYTYLYVTAYNSSNSKIGEGEIRDHIIVDESDLINANNRVDSDMAATFNIPANTYYIKYRQNPCSDSGHTFASIGDYAFCHGIYNKRISININI